MTAQAPKVYEVTYLAWPSTKDHNAEKLLIVACEIGSLDRMLRAHLGRDSFDDDQPIIKNVTVLPDEVVISKGAALEAI